MAVDNSAWDGNRAMGMCSSAADFRSICAGEHTSGEPDQRQHWALPHHFLHMGPNAAGVRNALSRLPQTQDLANRAAAQRHLEAHMAEISPQGKAAPLDPEEREAWYAGRIPRRVRIIPFGGPIPSADGKGRDLDGEYFDAQTDIKPGWFSERPVLWHHGGDPTGVMGDTLLGKAVNLHAEADGWWEDFWLTQGEARLERVRRLEERGASLFASSTPLQTPYLRTSKARDGRIRVWPHAESTLSTSPQNTFAVVRPAKALLDDFLSLQIDVLPFAKAVVDEIDDFAADLSETLSRSSSGDPMAKAEADQAAVAVIQRTFDLLDRDGERLASLLHPTTETQT